ncbi:MAG: hypothetical protein LBS74_01060 [Oscillospiraceae bacterium]|jgi:tetratricopeptide (TPR) repeat protein|nr:hypothetical protein [Oscillospiraceae bacterium]
MPEQAAIGLRQMVYKMDELNQVISEQTAKEVEQELAAPSSSPIAPISIPAASVVARYSYAPVPAKKKRTGLKVTLGILIPLVLIVGIVGGGLAYVYFTANDYLKSAKYDDAIKNFEYISWFADSGEKINQSKYEKAAALSEAKDFPAAIDIYEKLGGYEDSKDKLDSAKTDYIRWLLQEGKPEEAKAYLKDSIGLKEYDELKKECSYYIAEELLSNKKYQEAANTYKDAKDYSDAEALALVSDFYYKKEQKIETVFDVDYFKTLEAQKGKNDKISEVLKDNVFTFIKFVGKWKSTTPWGSISLEYNEASGGYMFATSLPLGFAGGGLYMAENTLVEVSAYNNSIKPLFEVRSFSPADSLEPTEMVLYVFSNKTEYKMERQK